MALLLKNPPSILNSMNSVGRLALHLPTRVSSLHELELSISLSSWVAALFGRRPVPSRRNFGSGTGKPLGKAKLTFHRSAFKGITAWSEPQMVPLNNNDNPPKDNSAKIGFFQKVVSSKKKKKTPAKSLYTHRGPLTPPFAKNM